jgi:hypothetical protein
LGDGVGIFEHITLELLQLEFFAVFEVVERVFGGGAVSQGGVSSSAAFCSSRKDTAIFA